MHGLVLVSFLDFVRERVGDPAAPADYSATEIYEDAEFERLLRGAAERARVPREELLRDFGVYAATTAFAALYPEYYEECGDTRTFLLAVEERIHQLVRTAMPGATPPRLHVVPLGPTGVAVTYTSERGLCELLEGLVIGTAAHYGEELSVEQPTCMKQGDTACAFMVMPAGP